MLHFSIKTETKWQMVQNDLTEEGEHFDIKEEMQRSFPIN